jgi:cupin 2 domain-containing protein
MAGLNHEKISQYRNAGSSERNCQLDLPLISRIMPSTIKIGHFCRDAPSGLPEEVSQTLLAGSHLRMERIVSHGQQSPPGFWYEQDEHEWVLLLEGAAALRFEQGNHLLTLAPGMYVQIPAHARHRVEWTAPDVDSIWLALFYRDG